jgi:outer membrane protein assembly factor BamB
MSSLRPTPVRTFARAAILALALVSVVAAPALAHEGGEIQWSQFQGGPGHPGTLAEAPEPPYREAWRFAGPDGSVSGAVIAGDVVFATGREAIYALDLGTGDIVWQVPRNGGRISMPAVGAAGEEQLLVFLEGPAAKDASAGASPSPSDAGDEAATEIDRSSLVAIDLATQQERWRTPLEAASRSGVTIAGDRAFAADDDGTVYAVDLASGDVAWTASAAGRVEAPPAAADGKVYVVGRDEEARKAELVALDEASGKVAWAFSPPAGAVAASAVSAADAIAVFGTADRFVRGLEAESGEIRFEALALTLFSPVSSPAFQPGNVFAADASGGVYRFDPSDGSRDWQHQLNDLVVRSSPVLVGSFLLVGTNDGRLVAFDVATGDLVWQTAESQGLVGAIALSHEAVVAVKGGRDAGLVAYEHDPEGSFVRVPSPTIVDPPSLYGNFALAFVIAAVVIYLPFRLLRQRMGPAFEPEDEVDESDGTGDGEDAS